MCYRRTLKQRLVVLPTEMISLYRVSPSLFLTISPILFTLPICYTLNGQTQTWNWGKERKKRRKYIQSKMCRLPRSRAIEQSIRTISSINGESHGLRWIAMFFTFTHCPGLAKFAYNDRVKLTVVNYQGLSLYLPPIKQLYLPKMVLYI